jgi:hypothetical protein
VGKLQTANEKPETKSKRKMTLRSADTKSKMVEELTAQRDQNKTILFIENRQDSYKHTEVTVLTPLFDWN